MTTTPDPKLLAKARAERDRNRADAHLRLGYDEPLSPAGSAALEVLAADRWILHHADDYVTGTTRLLDRYGYLTTPELREAERQSARDAHRVFNHVPIGEHRAAMRCHSRYIDVLEQAVAELAAQLDAVGGLAPVQRSQKGQAAAAATAGVRATVAQARNAWVTDSREQQEDAA